MKNKSLSSNDLGKIITAEKYPKITIKSFIDGYKNKLEKMMFSTEIMFNNHVINLTKVNVGNNGYRYFFLCPFCKRKSGVLYQSPINNSVGCRKCLKIRYKKTRYKGMIENQLI